MKKFTFLLFLLSFAAQAEMTEAQKLLAETDMVGLGSSSVSTEQQDSATCLLTPSTDIQVASPVIGVIKEVRVKRGDRVKKGQILVELHSEVEKATLKLNKAQADYGQRTIDRNNDLYQRKLISEQEKDEIIMNNKIYSYEMQQTRALIEQKIIRSPINGVVVETFLTQGEYVGEDPLMKLVNLNPLYVEVVLPSSRFGSIKKGDTAKVTLDSPLNSTHKAKVLVSDAVLDAASGTFGVRLELQNPGNKLPAGLKCQIDFK